MSHFIDLTGRRFGWLTVITRAGNRYGGTYWVCQCACGNVVVCDGKVLRGGGVVACARRVTHMACDVDGCDRPRKARGMCGLHYDWTRKLERAHAEGRVLSSVWGCWRCHRPVHARGVCGYHYRWYLRSNKAATFSEGTAAYDLLVKVPLESYLGIGTEDYVFYRRRRRRQAELARFQTQ